MLSPSTGHDASIKVKYAPQWMPRRTGICCHARHDGLHMAAPETMCGARRLMSDTNVLRCCLVFFIATASLSGWECVSSMASYTAFDLCRLNVAGWGFRFLNARANPFPRETVSNRCLWRASNQWRPCLMSIYDRRLGLTLVM